MKGITFSILAAGCSASSSLCLRKKAAFPAISMPGFLAVYYLISLLLSIVISPDIWSTPFSPMMFLMGTMVGICNIILLQLTERALQNGPAGLTFAFQSASSVFPGIILFLIFGHDWGFSYSWNQLIGVFLVILGLFLGARSRTSNGEKASLAWLAYASAAFAIQILALSLIQGRCILFDCNQVQGFMSNFGVTQAADVWFMPGLFGSGFIIQLAVFCKQSKPIEKKAAIFGSLAGIANFGSTCLLMLATKHALPVEKGILFPFFAVAAIIFCSIWAKFLYSEKFNVKAILACIAGVFIGSL